VSEELRVPEAACCVSVADEAMASSGASVGATQAPAMMRACGQYLHKIQQVSLQQLFGSGGKSLQTLSSVELCAELKTSTQAAAASAVFLNSVPNLM
jgi:hypothetical protein